MLFLKLQVLKVLFSQKYFYKFLCKKGGDKKKLTLCNCNYVYILLPFSSDMYDDYIVSKL